MLTELREQHDVSPCTVLQITVATFGNGFDLTWPLAPSARLLLPIPVLVELYQLSLLLDWLIAAPLFRSELPQTLLPPPQLPLRRCKGQPRPLLEKHVDSISKVIFGKGNFEICHIKHRSISSMTKENVQYSNRQFSHQARVGKN